MHDKQYQSDTRHHSQPASSQSAQWLEDKALQPKNRFNDSLYLSEVVEQQTYLLVHLLGYALLIFAAIDYVHILFPLRFTQPLWEFQTIGSLVEHVAIPLMGMVFVFYRPQGYISKLEKILLSCLSWLSLLVGLIYLLMIPLSTADTWRIYYANNAQITSQLSQHSHQLQSIKAELQRATTDEQLKQIATTLIPQSPLPVSNNIQDFKKQLSIKISEAERSIKTQAANTRANQTQALLKDAVKWNLGALIAGTLFILIWHFTHWARIRG